MSSLEEILTLESLDKNLFRSQHHRENFRKTLFGGQVLGQALIAMHQTTNHALPNSPLPNSLHAYFLRSGRSDMPVIYDVESVRDGRSFQSRRAVARQHGRSIFHMSSSFHKQEAGFEHQHEAPQDIPSPEELLASRNATIDPHIRQSHDKHTATLGMPFHLIPIDENILSSNESHPPTMCFWLKTTEKLSDSPILHFSALAFASDLGLLGTALLPHKTNLFDSDIFAASVDHAMWFHCHDFRADEWVLYQTTSPWAGQARGFAQGSLFTRTGKLIASTAQEGLIRPTGNDT